MWTTFTMSFLVISYTINLALKPESSVIRSPKVGFQWIQKVVVSGNGYNKLLPYLYDSNIRLKWLSVWIWTVAEINVLQTNVDEFFWCLIYKRDA